MVNQIYKENNIYCHEIGRIPTFKFLLHRSWKKGKKKHVTEKNPNNSHQKYFNKTHH